MKCIENWLTVVVSEFLCLNIISSLRALWSIAIFSLAFLRPTVFVCSLHFGRLSHISIAHHDVVLIKIRRCNELNISSFRPTVNRSVGDFVDRRGERNENVEKMLMFVSVCVYATADNCLSSQSRCFYPRSISNRITHHNWCYAFRFRSDCHRWCSAVIFIFEALKFHFPSSFRLFLFRCHSCLSFFGNSNDIRCHRCEKEIVFDVIDRI